MISRHIGTKLLLILLLVLAPVAAAYSQDPGRDSQTPQVQRGTISQPPSPPPDQGKLDPGIREGKQGGTQLRPSDSDVQAPTRAETEVAPGFGNTTRPVAQRAIGWPWLLLGLAIGFVLGIGFRRPAATVVREDIHERRDRAA
jgi:hypothetical protein